MNDNHSLSTLIITLTHAHLQDIKSWLVHNASPILAVKQTVRHACALRQTCTLDVKTEHADQVSTKFADPTQNLPHGSLHTTAP